MRSKLLISSLLSISLLSLLSPFSSQASAGSVVVNETCNVAVTFTATVPASVEQGKAFTVTDITVSPSNSYKFTVVSSVFDMTATNTSSTTYSQNSISTNPSPTTGHNTYVAYYPNWSLNAAGAVGSSIVIKLKKSVTVVQGYNTVTCNFTKTLATIPIVAAAVVPTPPPPTPAPVYSSPTPRPTSGSSTPSTKPSAMPSTKPSSTTSTQPSATPSPDRSSSSDTKTQQQDSDTKAMGPVDQSVSVIPLIVEVKDSSGKLVSGAEITLDGSKKAITDSKGQATFTNELTGGHSLLVAYKGQKTSRDIVVATADIGKATTITLPASTTSSTPIIIASAVAGAVGVGGACAALVVVRRRRAAAVEQPVASPMSIPGIIAGSAVEAPARSVIEPIPAIKLSAEQPSTQPLVPPSEIVPVTQSVPQETPPVAITPAPAPITPVPPVAPVVPTTATAATVPAAPMQPVQTAPVVVQPNQPPIMPSQL